MSELEVDDVIVLLLGSPTSKAALEDRISGITRLEKLVFLLERESSLKDHISEDTEFVAYNFGPFSAAVYKAVDSLSGYELIEDTGSINKSNEDSWEQIKVIGVAQPDPYATRDFKLTARGKQYYQIISEEIPSDCIEEIANLKEQFGSVPLRQLVRYVYQQYPEMTENSIIREEVLGHGQR